MNYSWVGKDTEIKKLLQKQRAPFGALENLIEFGLNTEFFFYLINKV